MALVNLPEPSYLLPVLFFHSLIEVRFQLTVASYPKDFIDIKDIKKIVIGFGG